MRLKTTGKKPATIKGIQPETVFAMHVADGVFHSLLRLGVFGGVGEPEPPSDMVITSGTDGAEWRTPQSKHRTGHAFDIRTNNLPERSWEIFAAQIMVALGKEFDVVIERDPDHIHVEFDPK